MRIEEINMQKVKWSGWEHPDRLTPTAKPGSGIEHQSQQCQACKKKKEKVKWSGWEHSDRLTPTAKPGSGIEHQCQQCQVHIKNNSSWNLLTIVCLVGAMAVVVKMKRWMAWVKVCCSTSNWNSDPIVHWQPIKLSCKELNKQDD